MSDYQKYPITNSSDSNQINSGSAGVFICDSSNPFDFSTLIGKNRGKIGFAIQLISRDGSDVEISEMTVNGVLGGAGSLLGSWQSGQGFGMEVESLSISGSGYAIIYLKSANGLSLPISEPLQAPEAPIQLGIGSLIIGETFTLQ